jgi:cytochrome bd ubiquinol oxidase subunit I
MDLDPLLISRLQFAFTIIFHIIFPTFTIGLSAYIATLCVMWMRTGKERYRLLAQFWTKIFAARSPRLGLRAYAAIGESAVAGVV